MSDGSDRHGENGGTRPTRGRHEAAIRAARTKRLKRRLEPFDAIDADVCDLLERITPRGGDERPTDSSARVILQAHTLRKELLLGKLKAEDMERRLEESSVVAEFENLKAILREHGVYIG